MHTNYHIMSISSCMYLYKFSVSDRVYTEGACLTWMFDERLSKLWVACRCRRFGSTRSFLSVHVSYSRAASTAQSMLVTLDSPTISSINWRFSTDFSSLPLSTIRSVPIYSQTQFNGTIFHSCGLSILFQTLLSYISLWSSYSHWLYRPPYLFLLLFVHLLHKYTLLLILAAFVLKPHPDDPGR